MGGKLDSAAAPVFTPTLTLPVEGEGRLLSPPHKSGAEQYWGRIQVGVTCGSCPPSIPSVPGMRRKCLMNRVAARGVFRPGADVV
jgi:hypothetical protein